MKIFSIPHSYEPYLYRNKIAIKSKAITFFLIIISNLTLVSCGGLEVQDLGVYTDIEDTVDTPDPQEQRRGVTVSDADTVTPTRLVHPSKMPIYFVDDLNFANMDLVISRQIQYFQKFRLTGTIRFGNHVYPRSILPLALQKFQLLYRAYHNCLRQNYNGQRSNTCIYAFHNTLINQFHIYEPNVVKKPVDRDNPTHFTGYYTPTILGSMRRTNRFRYPVYSKPKEYRLITGTRYQIDFQNLLAGHGYELLYTDNLFDIYNTQIQGSARVRFVDGNRDIYIAVNGSNGIGWSGNFILPYMRRRGMIRSRTMAAQRAYLDANPDRQAEVYKQSRTYSYFGLTDRAPGSKGIGVTEGRSIATDDKYYVQKGILAFVQAEKPNYETWRRTGQVRMQKFSRFVLDQDTGGKITGEARVDFYFGESKYGEVAASSLNTQGKLFFLMPKQIP